MSTSSHIDELIDAYLPYPESLALLKCLANARYHERMWELVPALLRCLENETLRESAILLLRKIILGEQQDSYPCSALLHEVHRLTDCLLQKSQEGDCDFLRSDQELLAWLENNIQFSPENTHTTAPYHSESTRSFSKLATEANRPLPTEFATVLPPFAEQWQNRRLMTPKEPEPLTPFVPSYSPIYEESIFGMSLGSSHLRVAYFEGDEPRVIADESGQKAFPSEVFFEEDGSILVGIQAQLRLSREPHRGIRDLWRWIGRAFSELPGWAQELPFPLIEGEDGGIALEIDGRYHSLLACCSYLLNYGKEQVEKYLARPIHRAVLTVPVYFEDHQRQAMKDAGELAGLEIVRIINEPTAAALACGLEEQEAQFIIVDLGGKNLDLTWMETGDGICEVLAHQEDLRLGSSLIEETLAQALMQEYRARAVSSEQDAYPTFDVWLEIAHQILREEPLEGDFDAFLPAWLTEFSGLELTTERIEAFLAPLFEQIKDLCEAFLELHGISLQEVEKVLLVGGGARLPLLQKLFRELYGELLFEPEEVDSLVALGAAIQGGVLSGEVKDLLLLDLDQIAFGGITDDDAAFDGVVTGEFVIDDKLREKDKAKIEPEQPSLSKKAKKVAEDVTVETRRPSIPAKREPSSTVDELEPLPLEKERKESPVTRRPSVSRDLLLLDVTPLSLGVETSDDGMVVVIPRNFTIPTRREEVLFTLEAHQTRLQIPIRQGERPMASANRLLATLNLEGLQPSPEGMTEVALSFDVDANGILHVTARDTFSGQVDTYRHTDFLSESEIVELVDDARTHQRDDQTWAEGRALQTQAHQLLRASRKILQYQNAQLTSEEHQTLLRQKQALEKALESDEQELLNAPVASIRETLHAYNAHLEIQSEQRPGFEKLLGEDAGRPGPIERLAASSKRILSFLQVTLGLYFVLVAQALDIFVDAVSSYVRGIFETWKTAKAIKRRLERDEPFKQLSDLLESLHTCRMQLSRLLRFTGYVHQEWKLEAPQPILPLELVLEIRYRLDQMKRDLTFFTRRQIAQETKRTFVAFILSYIPNPVAFLAAWKDLFVLAFYMKYSRREVEQMYVEWVGAYQNMACLLGQECEELDEYTLQEQFALRSHEIHMLSRVGYGYAPEDLEDMEACIEESRERVQRLLQLLCHAQPFCSPKRWSRVDLLQELCKMKDIGHWQTEHLLEWERWCTLQVTRILKREGEKPTTEERGLRLQEARLWQKRQRLEKKLSRYL